MKQKKILLLGGSAQQVVAIKTAKQLGYYTVLCDYLPDNPGQYVADKYYNASTTDVEAVYEIARSEQVDGILAYASDPAALPAAIVAERLGLPSNPAKSVEVLGLKYPWRQFLHKHGFACPKFFSFHPDTSFDEIKANCTDFTFPVVVKPTDSSGSKGVTRLDSWEGFEKAVAWADSYSRNKVLLIEEFIQRGFPHVIGGDIFVWDGTIVLYGEMSCLRDTEKSPLIPIGEQMPSGLNEKQQANVHNELQRIVSALDIRFGELNIEIILDKDDNVHFLELGPRAGGNMIPTAWRRIWHRLGEGKRAGCDGREARILGGDYLPSVRLLSALCVAQLRGRHIQRHRNRRKHKQECLPSSNIQERRRPRRSVRRRRQGVRHCILAF